MYSSSTVFSSKLVNVLIFVQSENVRFYLDL